MNISCSRREFLRMAAGCGPVIAGGFLASRTHAADLPQGEAHKLTVVAGKPRERGKQYAEQFKEAIHSFCDREIYQRFVQNPPSKDSLLRYAGACGKAIAKYSPAIHDELEGIAEGTGLKIEEVVLITLHEELYHQGILPAIDHCTAMAAGPPDTNDRATYVGQNWDWMPSVYGLSSMLLWKREEGPSVLAYSYPGLWVGAGLNSAGIALCWTSTEGMGVKGPRVGIPSYVLIAHLLYQETMKAVIAEARRANHAGWFTFVLADGTGRLVNIEGTPEKLVVEEAKGHLARVYCGSHEMTGTPKDRPVAFHPQCARMYELLRGSKGKLDRPLFQSFFADHQSTICKHDGTLDSMLFDCANKTAYIHRGPPCRNRWQTFGFELK
jgi:isopenicillin-N N-acyltransferase-like protein